MRNEMHSSEQIEDEAHQVKQYLTFLLGGKSYGLEILNIREIIEYSELTEVPMIPTFISGVINLRGRVVPVIDLGRRFTHVDTEISKRTSIIILDISNDDLMLELGIIVDMVNDVLSLSCDEIEPAPALGQQISTKFISGMAKIDGKLLILLDIANVLSVDELSMVGNLPTN